MDRWQEYLPISSASLLATFDSAMQRRVQFSPAERALFMACEFWSAVSARRLIAHSGAAAVETLQYMSILYSAMGARAVAEEMLIAIGEFRSASHLQAQRQCLSRLQENLLKTGDPVDLLIARLAKNLGLGSGGDWHYASAGEMALFA